MPFIVNRTKKRMSVRLADGSIAVLAPNQQVHVSPENAGAPSVLRMMHDGHITVDRELVKKEKVLVKKARKTGQAKAEQEPQKKGSAKKKTKI